MQLIRRLNLLWIRNVRLRILALERLEQIGVVDLHLRYYTIYRMSFSASRASIASPVRQRLRSRITFGPMRS